MGKSFAAVITVGLFATGCAPLAPMTKILEGSVPSGSIIAVQGYVSLEFEDQSIYPSREECESHDTARALWVDLPRSKVPDAWRNCEFAEVSGVYWADETGHFGGWPSGAIVSVSGIRVLRK